MKLVTFDHQGPRAGLVIEEQVHDIGRHTDLPADLLEIIRLGDAGHSQLRKLEASRRGQEGMPLAHARLLAPVPRPAKNIFCVGLNYQAHIDEARSGRSDAPPAAAKRPEFPTFFSKAPTTVIGPHASVPLHASVTTRLDWEVELAVFIGTAGVNIAKEDALSHVYGYTILNDISARDLQMRHGGQWFKGKTLDGTCPMGPWLVTRDELGAAGNQDIVLKVNGVTKQQSNTRAMIFDIATIISELSQGLTLEPGDIIATGTPDGIGAVRKPPEFLRAGDLLECEIAGIGTLRNTVAG